MDSVSQKNAIQQSIQNDLIKIVNGFQPKRMKEKLELFEGDNKSSLETCGIIQEYSRTKCFSIFGNRNCRRIQNTIYYTRNCPKGFFRQGKACALDCTEFNMREQGEFCLKNPDDEDLPCPHDSISFGKFQCLKPTKKYFVFIMNPFNLKL